MIVTVRARHKTLVIALALGAALVAGCVGRASPSAPDASVPATSAAASAAASPSGEPAASAGGPSLTPVPGSAAPSSPAIVGQTDTEWGRIWDALPATFPRYPGSIPTEPGQGPSSATLAVPTDPATAASQLQSALEAEGFSTEAQSGPFEDGSIVIDSVGEPTTCRVQTRLTPQSGTTLMTVFYGAQCPAP